MIWDNPQAVVRLVELHRADENSFSTISNILRKEFGIAVTRNACIGKARRLKLEMRAPRGPQRSKTDPKVLKERRNERRREFRFERLAPQGAGDLIRYKYLKLLEGPAETLPSEDSYSPPESRIGFGDFTNATCRWPYGDRDFRFCGHDGADMRHAIPYCPYHFRLAYLPVNRRQSAR